MAQEARTSRGMIAVLGILLFLFLVCSGLIEPLAQLVWLAISGWAVFIARVIPQVHVRWDLVGSTAIYCIALIVGSHLFLRWLFREMTKVPGTTNSPSRQWRLGSTLRCFGLIMLMFIVGMSAIGIAHQMAWLATSPEGIYKDRERPRRRAHCASNLKNIAAGMIEYSNKNDGRYPDDLCELVLKSEMTPEIVICPANNDVRAERYPPEKLRQELLEPNHCSYIYLGKGLTSSAPSETVLVVEPLENHGGDGINVLFADYHVEWFNRPRAEALLAKLGVEGMKSGSAGPTTRRSSAPATFPTTLP